MESITDIVPDKNKPTLTERLNPYSYPHDRIRKNVLKYLLSMPIIALSFFALQNVQAQMNSSSEYNFKAVYLYNFLQFIEWPRQVFSNDSSPVVVGVLGNDLLSNLLEQTVKNETIKDHAVAVRRLSSLDEIKTCHVLFISRAEEGKVPEILTKIKGKPILTVSESEGFAQNGGAINFYVEDNKLRFEINLEAVKAANLVVSSKLLRLAKIVEPEN
jgi:hypothetical protein